MPSARIQLLINNNYAVIVITNEIAEWLQGIGEDPLKLNSMHWEGVGASKWSTGRFLITKETSDYLKNLNRSSPVLLTFIDEQAKNSAGTVSFDQLYQLPHRPIHLRYDAGGNVIDGIFELTLVDERYFWQGNPTTASSSLNVTLPQDRTKYFDNTTNGANTPWAWTDLVTKLLSNLGISNSVANNISLDSGSQTPSDALFFDEPAAVTLDRVLASIGCVLGVRWNAAGGTKRYIIDTPFNLTSNIGDIEDSLLDDRYLGGAAYIPGSPDGNAWLDAIMPAGVIVRFPRQLQSTGTDSESASKPGELNQFFIATSIAGKPTNTTGRVGQNVVINDSMWAIGPIDSETNATALQQRADYLAKQYYRRWKLPQIDVKIRGFYSFSSAWCGQIDWCLLPTAPLTIARVNWKTMGLWGGDEDVGFEGFNRKRVVGVGGVQAIKTFDGSLLLVSPNQSTFEARITNKSGAFPAWTYTIQRVTKKDTTQTGYLQWVTDGTDLSATNRSEFAPQSSYPYTYGNGVTITASDGTVNSGSCKIAPIGVGAVVNVSTDIDQSGNTVYSFSEMNSAQ